MVNIQKVQKVSDMVTVDIPAPGPHIVTPGSPLSLHGTLSVQGSTAHLSAQGTQEAGCAHNSIFISLFQ